MSWTLIPNDALTLAQVPRADAPWEALSAFALTFDGYNAIGQRLGDLAHQHLEAGTIPDDLSELRGCLFFEQRRWRHFQEVPDERTLRHLRKIVEAIRARLSG